MSGPTVPGGGAFLPLAEAYRAAAGMRALREAAGLTPAGLAGRLGTGVSWVTGRERMMTRLREGHAALVAAVLGTDVAGLVAAGEQARREAGA